MTAGAFYIEASVATYLLAGFFLLIDEPVIAIAIIIISPFPCPPGIPC